jgi:hypothetical protein
MLKGEGIIRLVIIAFSSPANIRWFRIVRCEQFDPLLLLYHHYTNTIIKKANKFLISQNPRVSREPQGVSENFSKENMK